MGEGGAALVLENDDSAKARGAKILGYVLGCGEKGDGFHRTRSSPDGAPIIAAIRDALDDAGLTPDDIDYINAHGTGTPENDKMEAMGCTAVFGERMRSVPISLEQVDDRPHADRGGRGRGGVVAPDDRARPHPADDQLRRCPTRRSRSTWCRTSRATRRSTCVLSNSFGFGGQNTCLVFGGGAQVSAET